MAAAEISYLVEYSMSEISRSGNLSSESKPAQESEVNLTEQERKEAREANFRLLLIRRHAILQAIDKMPQAQDWPDDGRMVIFGPESSPPVEPLPSWDEKITDIKKRLNLLGNNSVTEEILRGSFLNQLLHVSTTVIDLEAVPRNEGITAQEVASVLVSRLVRKAQSDKRRRFYLKIPTRMSKERLFDTSITLLGDIRKISSEPDNIDKWRTLYDRFDVFSEKDRARLIEEMRIGLEYIHQHKVSTEVTFDRNCEAPEIKKAVEEMYEQAALRVVEQYLPETARMAEESKIGLILGYGMRQRYGQEYKQILRAVEEKVKVTDQEGKISSEKLEKIRLGLATQYAELTQRSEESDDESVNSMLIAHLLLKEAVQELLAKALATADQDQSFGIPELVDNYVNNWQAVLESTVDGKAQSQQLHAVQAAKLKYYALPPDQQNTFIEELKRYDSARATIENRSITLGDRVESRMSKITGVNQDQLPNLAKEILAKPLNQLVDQAQQLLDELGKSQAAVPAAAQPDSESEQAQEDPKEKLRGLLEEIYNHPKFKRYKKAAEMLGKGAAFAGAGFLAVMMYWAYYQFIWTTIEGIKAGLKESTG